MKLSVFLLFTLMPLIAEAQTPIPKLTRSLSKQLTAINGAMESEGTESSLAHGNSVYYYSFRLAMKLEVAFKIDGVLKLAVVPDMELLFKRPIPVWLTWLYWHYLLQ